jgi:hypothetical protein
MNSSKEGTPVRSATLLMLSKDAPGWVEACTEENRPEKWGWTE